MLIGHIEFVRERIEHMSALRDMQDYSNCGLRIADCGMKQFETARDRVAKRWPGVFEKSVFNPQSEPRDPQSFAATFGRASARESAGDLEGAAEDYLAAIKLDPTSEWSDDR